MGSAYDLWKKQKAQASESDSGGGILGFLSGAAKSVGNFGENVVGDVADIATGLTSLIGTGIKDVTGEFAEGLTKGLPDRLEYNHSSTLDDLLKAAPKAIAEDYGQRYGSVEGFKEGLYEDPLAFIGDALTILTAGGAGLAKGAQAASKVGKVGDDLAKLALQTGDDVGRTARVVDRILPGAKGRAVGADVPLGGEMSTLNQITGRVDTGPLPLNPVRRIRPQALNRMRTEGLDNLDKRIALMDEALSTADDGSPGFTKLRAEREVAATVRAEAALQPNARLKTLRASNKEASQLAKRMVNESGSKFISSRDRLMAAHNEILHRLPKEEVPRFWRKAQGLEPVMGAGRLDFDSLVQRLDGPLEDAPRLHRIAQVVKPHTERIRQLEADFTNPESLLTSPLGKRVQGEYLDRLSKDGRFNDLLPGRARMDALTPEEYLEMTSEVEQAAALEIESGKRLVEIVGGEPLAASDAGIADDVADVLDDTRLLNFEKEAGVLMGAGKGDYTSILERLYRPLQVKEKVERGLDSLNDATPAIVLDDVRRSAKVKAPVYYPNKDVLSNKVSDFLEKKGTHGMARRAEGSSFKRMRGATLEAQLRNIKDAIQTDPSEAYGRMAAEITGFEQTMKLIDNIKNEFGLRFEGNMTRDRIPEGWVLINPDAIRVMLRKSRDLNVGIGEAMLKGADDTQAIADAVKGSFGDGLKDDLAELVATKGETFAVPQVVAERLDEAASWSLPPKIAKQVRLFHDAPVNVWRSGTLYLRPAFYLNNAVGNTTFLGLQGGKLSHVIRQLDKRYSKALKDTIDSLGVTDDVEGGFWSAALQRNTHLGPAENTRTGRAIKATKESRTYKTAHKPIDMGQKLNDEIENAFRRESFMTAAEKDLARRGVKVAGRRFIRSNERLNAIMKYGVDNPDAVTRWVDDMNDVMNNYRALGPFERKVTRRFIAPFWPFYKHATKTLFKMPFKHPAKTRILQELGALSREMVTEEIGEVEEWLEGAVPVAPGDEPGEVRFLSARGQNPLAGVIENPLAMLGPIPKVIMEQASGRNTFTGKEFTAPGVVEPFGSDNRMRFNEETQQFEPVDRTLGGFRAPVAPNPLEHLLGQFPLYNTAKDFVGGGARFGTGEVIEDEATGEPLYPTDPMQELLKLMGYSTVDYNVGRYQQRLMEDRLRAASMGP